ncbi:hypothetical protein [Aliarcobacter butzleri]|uniref:hypothetical protein n=1 Tax=Aliarcobacter butzleri TaxID=28197 RepID=UPI003B223C23
MSKMVLDEREVLELMETFDWHKSLYLQKLEKVIEVIEKLDEIQKTQKTIENEQQKYLKVLSKLQNKDEKEMIENYSLYLSFLAQKIKELGKNEDLKKIEKIVSISNKIVNLSVLKITVLVAAVTTGINFLILK